MDAMSKSVQLSRVFMHLLLLLQVSTSLQSLPHYLTCVPAVTWTLPGQGLWQQCEAECRPPDWDGVAVPVILPDPGALVGGGGQQDEAEQEERSSIRMRHHGGEGAPGLQLGKALGPRVGGGHLIPRP